MAGLLQAPPDKFSTSQFLDENVTTEGSCVYLGTDDIIGMLVVFQIKVNVFLRKNAVGK